ncbi:MAG: hypothetical protein MUD10_04135 [Candidatus Pacebacteria bacterium]|jgi:hypothetical protein|nr:hypothetical protein [Candidatus Paceibacterota bacterium]
MNFGKHALVIGNGSPFKNVLNWLETTPESDIVYNWIMSNFGFGFSSTPVNADGLYCDCQKLFASGRDIESLLFWVINASPIPEFRFYLDVTGIAFEMVVATCKRLSRCCFRGQFTIVSKLPYHIKLCHESGWEKTGLLWGGTSVGAYDEANRIGCKLVILVLGNMEPIGAVISRADAIITLSKNSIAVGVKGVSWPRDFEEVKDIFSVVITGRPDMLSFQNLKLSGV